MSRLGASRQRLQRRDAKSSDRSAFGEHRAPRSSPGSLLDTCPRRPSERALNVGHLALRGRYRSGPTREPVGTPLDWLYDRWSESRRTRKAVSLTVLAIEQTDGEETVVKFLLTTSAREFTSLKFEDIHFETRRAKPGRYGIKLGKPTRFKARMSQASGQKRESTLPDAMMPSVVCQRRVQ